MMIISKKTLNRLIDEAVNQAVADVNAYRDEQEEKIRQSEYIERRFKEYGEELYDAINRIEKRIDALEYRLQALDCKVKHKKIPLCE